MAGPVTNDSQYKQLPTLVIPSSIGNKMGQFNSSSPITASRVPQGGSSLFNNGGIRQPMPAQISSGGRTMIDPNATPVNYNPGLFPNAGGQQSPFFNRFFSNQNPILQNMGGILGAGYRGGMEPYKAPMGQAGANIGAGVGAGAGIDPDEAKWKKLAEKFGIDWNVTKQTYMRSPRNPNFSPSTAMELQLDDKAWGDAARAAGILTGNPDYDKNVWDDHYNANGNMARDPMAGHNYAQMAYEANQQQIQDMVNGVPQPPAWL